MAHDLLLLHYNIWMVMASEKLLLITGILNAKSLKIFTVNEIEI